MAGGEASGGAGVLDRLARDDAEDAARHAEQRRRRQEEEEEQQQKRLMLQAAQQQQLDEPPQPDDAAPPSPPVAAPAVPAGPEGRLAEGVRRIHMKIGPCLASLTQVKQKMATGDLNSWRQTAEMVQLVANAHSAVEKMRGIVKPLVEMLSVMPPPPHKPPLLLLCPCFFALPMLRAY